ncbi:adenylate kinase family protein [Candidatus Nanosyncoccus alces]|uniref:Adenylate kinase n=1 Tax=Candidatus Nanosyncoccus alces TaxID=2171997 RepID=A0ABY0FLN9_9BACT|nr:nucleoside monophosphate kinase [Candidatus Nanosyncoccus alces]RYC74677.1 adenylate kinase [Candidatus Nanosyncoccus alces]
MIILFGLAGSGKGTQGRALAEIFGWRWLSVGEAIRQTNEYDDIINQGNMIPDADVIKMMGKQIAKAEAEGFDVILDGYPRDAVQTKWLLDNMPEKLDGAIILEVPKEELLERLALRGRDDDKERASIERRFAIYEQNISSILPLLENANIPIKRINGVGKVEEVTDRLIGVTKELNANATEQESDVNGGEIERSYGE